MRKIVLVIEKKLLKFEAEGREFAKFLRLLEFKQLIVRTIFDNRMVFLTGGFSYLIN